MVTDLQWINQGHVLLQGPLPEPLSLCSTGRSREKILPQKVTVYETVPSLLEEEIHSVTLVFRPIPDAHKNAKQEPNMHAFLPLSMTSESVSNYVFHTSVKILEGKIASSCFRWPSVC